MKVVTASQMRQFEKKTDAGGVSYATMMEKAGRAVAQTCQEIEAAERPVLVLVGPGNNGGDGLVAARYLHQSGRPVTLYLWKRDTENDENFRLTQEQGIPFSRAEEDTDLATLRRLLAESDLVLDALLGTGVTRPIGGKLKHILEALRLELERRRGLTPRRLGYRRASSEIVLPPSPARYPLLVAVDLPTGLNPDSGAIDPATVPADVTVTFAFPKLGQFLFPGAGQVGQLVVADIGIPSSLAEQVQVELATPEMVSRLLPARPAGAHKGTFGKALVVAGCTNYTGAAYLAGASATRVGAGLVTMALARTIYPIVAAALHETTFLLLPDDLGALVPDGVKLLGERLGDYQALLLGPGLGREAETVEFVHRLLGLADTGRRGRLGFLAETSKGEEAGLPLPPTIVDADGLNALVEVPEWWRQVKGKNILTPHPGEMARLRGRTASEVQADRMGTVRQAAVEWGQVVVLKGAYTLIAAPDGRVIIIPFANPGLATAGTGDVLAGAVVGFLAQGLEAYQAAIAGAYIHGLAGELARREVGEAGMVAGDLLPRLPVAIEQLS